MRKLPLLSLLMALGLASPIHLPAQNDIVGCDTIRSLQRDGVDGTLADFAHLARVTGRATSGPTFVRRWSDAPAVGVCGVVPWERRLAPVAPRQSEGALHVLPVRSRAVVNTGYPTDRNNGALLAGRGLSAELGGGAALRWGAFSAALAPELLYQSNHDFVVSPLGRSGLDWPQRVGTAEFAALDPGQSYARVDAYGAGVGVSTENLWLGPGLESSILLSSTAPGFPHAFAGTSRPVDVRIGRLDADVFLGRLDESPMFDTDEDNDHRLLLALVAGFEPRGAPGLHLGVGRVAQWYSDAGTADEAAADASDALTSLYFRWLLPESGFELFGEWARYDESPDRDTTVEPEQGRAYLIGLQKVFDMGARWVRVRGEIANLNPRIPAMDRGTARGVYRHTVIGQGHTHRGQLLGAWTGPGSDYQVVAGDLLESWGGVGIFGERVRRNVDVYFASPSLRRGYPLKHDLELTAGARAMYLWRSFDVNATAAYSHRRNRDFLPPDIGELEQGYRVDSNWNLQLELTWHPDLSRLTRPTR